MLTFSLRPNQRCTTVYWLELVKHKTDTIERTGLFLEATRTAQTAEPLALVRSLGYRFFQRYMRPGRKPANEIEQNFHGDGFHDLLAASSPLREGAPGGGKVVLFGHILESRGRYGVTDSSTRHIAVNTVSTTTQCKEHFSRKDLSQGENQQVNPDY